MTDIKDLTEAETRKRYIDSDLKRLGWVLSGPKADVQMEYEVTDMAGVAGQVGFVDYVLFGEDGRPLAVIEAKKASIDPKVGQEQAKLYAETEFEKYRIVQDRLFQSDFDRFLELENSVKEQEDA